jgi:hypothetical protein
MIVTRPTAIHEDLEERQELPPKGGSHNSRSCSLAHVASGFSRKISLIFVGVISI